MEQLIILLIVGAVALAKWYAKKAAGLSEDTPSHRPITPVPSQALRPDRQESEEERMRKFFEALGVPATTTPPPKVAPPARQPRLPKTRARREVPKPAMQEWSPTPVTQARPPAIEPLPFPETASLPPSPAAAEAERPVPAMPTAVTLAPANIRSMVQSADSIRAAILLREILGPPRGLQSYGYSLLSSH